MNDVYEMPCIIDAYAIPKNPDACGGDIRDPAGLETQCTVHSRYSRYRLHHSAVLSMLSCRGS